MALNADDVLAFLADRPAGSATAERPAAQVRAYRQAAAVLASVGTWRRSGRSAAGRGRGR